MMRLCLLLSIVDLLGHLLISYEVVLRHHYMALLNRLLVRLVVLLLLGLLLLLDRLLHLWR